MLNWTKNEIDALSGRFISSEILDFILNNTIDRHTFKTDLIQWNTYIFNNSNIDKIIHIENMMIKRALDFQKRSNNTSIPMIIYWFPTDYKKELPRDKKSLDVNEINSAATFHGQLNKFIALYRLEEAPKVLYHELIHYFELDSIIPYGEDSEYTIQFNLKSPCLLRETYCELMALLLNVEDISIRENKNFMELYSIEYAFSILQKDKILNFFNIKNASDFHKLKSDTNVFTYFICKTAILLSIDNPIDFLKKMEEKHFKLHSIQFLKSFINNGFDLLFKEKVDLNLPILNNTLRMTIIE